MASQAGDFRWKHFTEVWFGRPSPVLYTDAWTGHQALPLCASLGIAAGGARGVHFSSSGHFLDLTKRIHFCDRTRQELGFPSLGGFLAIRPRTKATGPLHPAHFPVVHEALLERQKALHLDRVPFSERSPAFWFESRRVSLLQRVVSLYRETTNGDVETQTVDFRTRVVGL